MKTPPNLFATTAGALPRRRFLVGSALAVGGLAWGAEATSRVRLGFAGLKHGHGLGVLKMAVEDPRVSIVAVAEDEEQNRQQVERIVGQPVQYKNYRELLDAEPQLDAVVVCEEYGRRGGAAIAALQAGHHVFSDKPLCTRLEELKTIAALAAEKHREVHVDFSLRHMWAKAAELLQQGGVGDIVNCTFSGPHSLNYEHRPKWYFTPGMHGGIINDLMGHGVDFVHWITRRAYVEVLAASRASVGLPQQPDFETFGDAHFRMDGGASIYGEVDYLVPAGHASGWKCRIIGTKGDATIGEPDGLILRPSGAAEQRLTTKEMRAESSSPFKDFITLLTAGTAPLRTTAECLHGSLATLLGQEAAATGKTHVSFPALKAS